MLNINRNTFIFADKDANPINRKRVVYLDNVAMENVHNVCHTGDVKPCIMPTGWGDGNLFSTPGMMVTTHHTRGSGKVIDAFKTALAWDEEAAGFKNCHQSVYAEGFDKINYLINDPCMMYRDEHMVGMFPKFVHAPFLYINVLLTHRDDVNKLQQGDVTCLKYKNDLTFSLHDTDVEIIADDLELIVYSSSGSRLRGSNAALFIVYDRPEDIEDLMKKYAPNLKGKRVHILDLLKQVELPRHAIWEAPRAEMNKIASENTEYDFIYYVDGYSQADCDPDLKHVAGCPDYLFGSIIDHYRKKHNITAHWNNDEYRTELKKAIDEFAEVKFPYTSSIIFNMTNKLPEIAKYCAYKY